MDRPKHTLTRRDFLITGAATGIALIEGSSIALASDLKTTIQKGPENLSPIYAQILNPLDAVKKLEAELGDRPLTVGQSQELIGRTGEWLAGRKDGVLPKPEFLAANTYVLTHGEGTNVKPAKDPDVALQDHPVVNNFFESYRNKEYSDAFAQKLVDLYYEDFLGAVPGNTFGAFINLDHANNPLAYSGREITNRYQYIGTDANPIRYPITPVTLLRSVNLHENFHLATWREFSPLDPDIIQYLKRNYRGDTSAITIDGAQDNFKALIEVAKEGGAPVVAIENRFNEFSTDHQGIRLSQDGELPFWVGYGQTPLAHFNFRQVLEQSGLPLPEFSQLFHGNKLKEFYREIALGAQVSETHPVKIFDESAKIQDILDLAIPMFAWWKFPVWNPTSPNQPDIRTHFPGVLRQIV